MGYITRKHANGTTKHFWPDDTDDEFYIAGDATLEEIYQRCDEKWGGLGQGGWSLAGIRIHSEFTHTDCLGYDLMDWGDWTNFLRITKEK